jgi:hypothetical protein
MSATIHERYLADRAKRRSLPLTGNSGETRTPALAAESSASAEPHPPIGNPRAESSILPAARITPPAPVPARKRGRCPECGRPVSERRLGKHLDSKCHVVIERRAKQERAKSKAANKWRINRKYRRRPIRFVSGGLCSGR